jgi:hypothetical protein
MEVRVPVRSRRSIAAIIPISHCRRSQQDATYAELLFETFGSRVIGLQISRHGDGMNVERCPCALWLREKFYGRPFDQA